MIQFVDFSRGDIGINMRMLQKRSGALSLSFLAFLLVLCSLAMPASSLYAHGAKNSSALSGASLLSTNVFGIGISSFSPASVQAGSGGFELTIILTGRVAAVQPTVTFDGAAVTLISSGLNYATVDIPASLITSAGSRQVAVTDYATGTTAYNNFAVTQPSSPVPQVGTLNPSTIQAGSGSFQLIVNGWGFVSGVTQFTFNGQSLGIPSSLHLTYAIFNVPASYITNAGTVQVTATNPAPGGGSASNTFTITSGIPLNPAPIIHYVTPASMSANDGTSSLTINNNNGGVFGSFSSVTIGGYMATVLSYSSYYVTVALPSAITASAGIYDVIVTNAGPGGGTSSAQFTVNPAVPNNPVPQVGTLNPSTIQAGSGSFQLIVNGWGFVSGVTQFTFNGQSLGIPSSLHLTYAIFNVPASYITNAGTVQVTATNPAPGGGSASNTFTVTPSIPQNPVPAIQYLSPTSMTTNDGTSSLTIVNGSGSGVFGAFSSVTIGGYNATILNAGAYSLVVALPSQITSTPGTYNVIVTNQGPGGGTSAPAQFTVNAIPNNPAPQLGTISPSSIQVASGGLQLIVNGWGFVSGVTTFTFNGQPITPTSLGYTYAVFNISAQDVRNLTPPQVIVSVNNIGPGGGSASSSLTVTEAPTLNPVPTIHFLSPNSMTEYDATTTLTINNNDGSVFGSFSSVTIGQNNATQYNATILSRSSYYITIQLPDAVRTNPGTYNVVVTNAGPGGGASAPAQFTVLTAPERNPVPVITSLSPSSVQAGSGAFTLTLNGSGFSNNTQFTYDFNNQPLTPTSVADTYAVFTVPTNYVTTPGDYTVKAFNFGPGGGTAISTLTVTPIPTPTINSLSPAVLIGNGIAQNLTITGNNFFGSSVQFNGQGISVGSITPTSLQVTVLGYLLVNNGYTANIKVINSDGQIATIPIFVKEPTTNTNSVIELVDPPHTPVQNPNNQIPITVAITVSGIVNDVSSIIIGGVTVPVTQTPVPNTPGSYTLSFTIPPALLTVPGQLAISFNSQGKTLSTLICITTEKPTITKVILTPHGANTDQIRRDQAAKGFVITLEGTNFTSQSRFTFGLPPSTFDITPAQNLWNTDQWTSNRVVLSVNPDQVFGNRVRDSIRTAFPYIVWAENPSCTDNNGVTLGGGGSGNANIYITAAISPLSVRVGRPPFDLSVYGASSNAYISVAGMFGGQLVGNKLRMPTQVTVGGGLVFTYSYSASSPQPKKDTVVIDIPLYEISAQYPDTKPTIVYSRELIIGYKGPDPASSSISMGFIAGSFNILPPESPKITSISPTTIIANKNNIINIKGEFTYIPAVSGNPPNLAKSTYFEFWQDKTLKGRVRTGNIFWGETYQAISDSWVRVPGTYTVKLITPNTSDYNDLDAGGTTSVNILVRSGVPVITGVATSVGVDPVAGTATELTITGSNFNPTTRVYLNGKLVSSTNINFNKQIISLTANDLPTPGIIYSITVVNPDEQVQATWDLTASAKPTATINSITPSSITLPTPGVVTTRAILKGGASTQSSDDITVTIVGSNFEAGTVISVNGRTFNATFVDSTRMTILLPASMLANPTELRITAHNVGQLPDSTSQSQPIIFKVKTPVPVLTALSSATTTATLDSRTWTLTVSGQNFFLGAKVIYNGTTLATSAVKVESATSLRVVLPDVPITSAQYTLAVVNPSPTDSASNKLTLNVVYPQPVLHTTLPVSPVTTTATLAPWMLTLRGGNFSDQAVVSIDRQSVPFVYVNSTQLKVPMPETVAIAARTYRIVITNPTPGGGSTDTLTVNVVHPAPVLDSLSLTRTMAGSPVSIRLVGSRFASSAGVLLNGAPLTSGVTVESPTSILVALTGTQVRTVGNYNFSVNNPAPGGGTSSVRTLRVVPAGASTVEFSRVTTAIVAGSRLSNVTLRFRDESGNLTDFDGVLRFSNITGTSTGTLSLRRSSIGVSTATATRFNLADTYTLSVDSVPAATGKRDFEVVPATDFSVVVSGVPTAQVAGATLPSFTVSYFDRLGNATDDRLGEIRIRHDQKGYLHVLPRIQTDEGVYITSPLPITTTGSYSVFVTGITVSNITGNRTVSIAPAATVLAEFQYVDSSFAAGGKQTTFRVTYRDSYGNLAEGPTTVAASGTTELGTSTASIALTKSATALYYTAEATAFTVPGAYNLAIAGISQYSGQRAFSVTSLSAYYASVSTLPQTATAGAQLGAFTIRLTDRLSNPITGNIGTVALRHSRGYYHALSTQAQANGQYSVSGMQLTTVGTYTISVGGIVTENITGNRVITVEQAPVASAQFQYVDSSFNVGGKQVAFRVTYRDAFGNLLDGADSVIASNGSSTATIMLTKYGTGLGVYTAAATQFTVPGNYTLSVPGISQYMGQRTFTVNSIAASNALVTGVSPALTAGTPLSAFTIRLTDSQNNPVSGSIGAVTLRHERGFTHTLLTQAQANGVYSVQGVPVTTVGTYTVNIAGIAAANITGNRAVLIAPASVASAAFQYVDTSITAGGKQTAFRVTYRDAFGNLVSGPENVTASNGSSTASIALTSVSNGVYTAVSTPFTIAGNYSLTIAGVTSEGTRTFTVLPHVAATVEIRGVQASINESTQQSSITLAIADRYGNPTDRASVLRFTRTTTNPASTGTITLTRTALGVMTAEATAFSIVGAYRLSVDGISASVLLGTTTFTVTTAATTTSSFKRADAQLTTTQHNTETSVGVSEEVVAGVMPMSVALFPNPASESVTLTGSGFAEGRKVSLTLVNTLGQTVLTLTQQPIGGTLQANVDVRQVPSGAYTAVLSDGVVQRAVRFVKQ